MTDDRGDPELEARLGAWFAGEVSRAERDLAAGSGTRSATRHRTARSPLVAIAGLAVVLVFGAVSVAVWRQPATTNVEAALPTSAATTPTPSESPGPTQPPDQADPVTAWFRDGVPSAIDGEPLMRPTEALPDAQAGTLAGLVGGWVRTDIVSSCAPDVPSPGATPDPHRCERLYLSESRTSETILNFARPDGMIMDAVVAVIRVRAGEGRPTLITTADPSFRETRAADGIPTILDGETVYRPRDLEARVATATDDRTFLAGGWIRPGTGRGCQPSIPGRATADPLAIGAACGGAFLSETPYGDLGLHLVTTQPVTPGSVVVRVHTRDPRSSTCTYVSVCESAVVADAVEWSGDSWSTGQPQDILDVVQELSRSMEAGVSVVATPVVRRPDVFGSSSLGSLSLGCDYGIPPQAWQVTSDARLGQVFVYASIAERERFAPSFRASGLSSKGADGRPCQVTNFGGSDPSRWVAVENILVEVKVGHVPTAADEDLVRQIEDGLGGS